MAPVDAFPSRRILLIEDHRDSRETLRLLMEYWGHSVEVAEDGLTGVRKALDWRPEVGVVDIGLPRLDGYQVARQVRAALKDDIFLIALTAYGQPQDRERALAAGFDVHLSKPADFQKLSRLLRNRTRPALS
jgi:CheY-like chemotaxis protein